MTGEGEIEQPILELPPSQQETARQEAETRAAYMTRWAPRWDEAGNDPIKKAQVLNNMYEEVTLEKKALQEAAGIDSVTGLFTRGRFVKEAILAVERAQRDGKTIIMLMGDCDHFREINDQYGHPGGDRVLGNIGKVIREGRATDPKGRVGGDEIAVILEGGKVDEGVLEASDGILVAARIRAGVAQNALKGVLDKNNNPAKGSKTMSWGIAVITPDRFTKDPAKDYAMIYSVADGALYHAKENGGRNCIAINDGELRIVDPTTEAKALESSRLKNPLAYPAAK